MRTGMVIEVDGRGFERRERQSVEVLDGENLQARYDRLTALVLRMGDWLMGPRAALLPREAWEGLFDRYRDHQDQLRLLGDRLRPVSLRDRQEPLAGDALVGEVLELFAA